MTLNPLELIVVAMLGVAVLLGLLRLILGPTAPDRIVSVDTISVIITAGLTGIAAWFGSALYLDVALIYGILAFVGVVALARTIEGGRQ